MNWWTREHRQAGQTPHVACGKPRNDKANWEQLALNIGLASIEGCLVTRMNAGIQFFKVHHVPPFVPPFYLRYHLNSGIADQCLFAIRKILLSVDDCPQITRLLHPLAPVNCFMGCLAYSNTKASRLPNRGNIRFRQLSLKDLPCSSPEWISRQVQPHLVNQSLF